MDSTLKKICIIGAGPCGLVSARHLKECQNSQVTVFEASNQIGGLWVYDERTELDSDHAAQKKDDRYFELNNHFHSSIYPKLLSNIPYFFMAFKDLSHADLDPNTPIFIERAQHEAYLNAYAEKFDLYKNIVLGTLVKSVRLYKNLSKEQQEEVKEKRKFVVTTVKSKGPQGEEAQQVHSFDYVVVSNGHYSKPYVPKIQGREKFAGKVFTSKNYRHPNAEHFINKKVLVLGTSFSATDVVVQVLEEALASPESQTEVTLVGRSVGLMLASKDFEKYRESGKLKIVQGEIEKIVDAKTVKITDGSEHEIETIVLCTGYEYGFPFLDFEQDRLIDFYPQYYRGKFVAPLYKRFITIREPNLFFINLAYFSINTPFSEIHAMLAKEIIDGEIKLPGKNEMFQDFLEEADAIQRYAGKSVVNLLRFPSPFEDIKFWETQRTWLRSVKKDNEEKAKEYYDAFIGTYMKMGELYFTGNILKYKEFDFHTIFSRELRNTSEFI